MEYAIVDVIVEGRVINDVLRIAFLYPTEDMCIIKAPIFLNMVDREKVCKEFIGHATYANERNELFHIFSDWSEKNFFSEDGNP